MLNKALQKRIRIFAGPNGSGKSTLFPKIKKEYQLRFGYYINPDNIFDLLTKKGFIDLLDYGIKTNKQTFSNFYENSGWIYYTKDTAYVGKWTLNENIIALDKSKLRLYDAAILSDFFRNELLKLNETFTFETVMSHISKIDFIKYASSKGYKVYLYFISVEDPEINLNRIKLRVDKGGHDVPQEKIESRYTNTLELLIEAVRYCYRSFIFDNTNEITLIASISPEKNILLESDSVPRWFQKYVLNKITKAK